MAEQSGIVLYFYHENLFSLPLPFPFPLLLHEKKNFLPSHLGTRRS